MKTTTTTTIIIIMKFDHLTATSAVAIATAISLDLGTLSQNIKFVIPMMV